MLDEFRSTSITWDKATRRIYSPIAANASDSNGRKLNIQVVNSGQVENLTGATLHLYWETKDKTQHGLDAFTASDISKGEFEIFYTTGMLSNVGELNATLVLVDGTGKVVSDWFKITVTRGIDEDAIESENSFTTLTQALIDISNLEQNYAPRLNDLTAQLQQKANAYDVFFKENGININDFDEPTRQTFLEAQGISVNYVLGEGNVKPYNTSFTKNSKNVFDKSKVRIDGFLNYNTGAIDTLSGYSTGLEYIPVKAGEPVTMQYVRVYVFYDESKVAYIGDNTGSNSATTTITPTQDGYLRVTAQTNSLGNTMVEYGDSASEYVPYSVVLFNIDFNEQQINQIRSLAKAEMVDTGALTVEKSGDVFVLKSLLENGEEISIETTRKTQTNGLFNFLKTKVNGELIHDTPDDVTPIRIFSTVGANHGYTSVIVIGMANHGKTPADLGSIWTDGNTEYTLLKIDGNNLTFGCPYSINPNGWTEAEKINPVANLSHVSGATSTSNVDISMMSGTPQLYPSVNNVSVKYILDGEEITEDGLYYGKELNIKESYTIMDYKEIIDFAQANIGVSYANDSIAGVVELSNTFSYSKGLKCTTYHSLKALDKIRLYRCGFLQSGPMLSVGYTTKRWMPNVVEKNGFDFANGIDLDAYSTSLVFTHADSVDANVPPNHYVDWLYNNNQERQYGFSMGYIVDKTNSKNADRVSNSPNTWDMRSTKKSYPIAVENKTLEAGDCLNYQGFRNYIIDEEVKEATNITVVKDRKDTYLYADFNSLVQFYSKSLDDDLGKNINLLQNESLVNKNDVVSADGVILSSSLSLGNAVFKIN